MIYKFSYGGESYDAVMPNLKFDTPSGIQTPSGGARRGASSRSGKSSAGSKSESTGIDTKILLTIAEKTLPGDNADLMRLWAEYVSNELELSSDPKIISAMMAAFYNKLSLAITNKETYEKVYEKAASSNCLLEIAISNTGALIVQDLSTKKLKQITPSEYYRNRSLYATVTNGMLMSLRRENVSFDNTYLDVVQNAISGEKVQDYIKSLIGDLNSTSKEESSYYDPESKQIIRGVNIIMASEELEGKNIFEIVSKDKNNLTQVTSALNYIYRSLPYPHRNYLKVQLALEGKNPENPTELYNYLAELMTGKALSDTSQKVKYGPLSSVGSEGDGGSKAETDEKFKANNPLLYLYLNKGKSSQERFVIPGVTNQNGIKIDFDAKKHGFINEHGDSVDWYTKGKGNIKNILESTGAASILNLNSAYLGNVKVPAEQLDKLAFNSLSNDGGPTTIILPYIEENGAIHPDFNLLYRLSAVDKSIIDNKYKTKTEKIKDIKKILMHNNPKYGPGLDELKAEKWAMFLVDPSDPTARQYVYNNEEVFYTLPVITSTEEDLYHTEDGTVSPFLKKIANQQGSSIDLVGQYRNEYKTRTNLTIASWNVANWFKEDLYSGTIYIPFNKDLYLMEAKFGRLKDYYIHRSTLDEYSQEKIQGAGLNIFK